MRNFSYFIFFVGIGALLIYAAREGLKRQARIDCMHAARICEDYHDVHRGECAECRIVEACLQNDII